MHCLNNSQYNRTQQNNIILIVIFSEDKYIWQRPSPAQVECIVEFFEKNPALNKGYIKTESQRDIRQKAWQKLAFRLNNMEGCTKNFQQWLRVS